MGERYRLSASTLLSLFKNRSLTCEEYMKRVVSRSRQMKDLNYFTQFDEADLLARAQQADKNYEQGTARALEGLPLALKDNIAVKEMPCTGATPSLWGRHPVRTAPVAQKLLDKGAIPTGKTNMEELAYGITSNNYFTGPCRNFYNRDHSCFGSSGGSAGAVAADIVPCALGTDTGGSVRLPASASSVFGYKPSIGRWPVDYGLKITHERDTVGPLARTMEDIALLDEHITGEKHAEGEARNVRIGVPKKHFWERVDPEIERRAYSFVEKLAKQGGFTIVQEDNVEGVQETLDEVAGPAMKYEALARLQQYIEENGYTDLTLSRVLQSIRSPGVKSKLIAAYKRPVSEEAYAKAQEKIGVLQKEFERYAKKNRLDAWVFPTAKLGPLPLGSGYIVDHLGREENELLIGANNTHPGSFCKLPSIAVPCGRKVDTGVPYGIEFDSLSGNDKKLIAIGREVERTLLN